VQATGGGRDVALLEDGDKGLELAAIHKIFRFLPKE
jgi:hypothetical protein